MKRALFPRVPSLALLVGVVAPTLLGAFAAGCSKSSDDGTSAGVSAIVFIKRQHTVVGDNGQVTVDVAGGNGQVLDYQRYVPGGSLNILAPARADGVVTNITADFPQADFNGADVSFDGTQAVFSMKKDPSDHYHLYTAQLTAGPDGKFEIHAKTGSNADDINPVYLPNDRIAFVTNQMYTQMGTRADEYEHSREVTQLATITVSGGDADRRLAAQNLSHTVAPFLRADGKIGYSRWEHLGPVNDVKLFAANPDGTQMIAVGGQHGKPANALFSVREEWGKPNVMIGIGTTRDRTIHAGSLIEIDARNANDPVCVDPTSAAAVGHACLDEENVQYKILTPDVPTTSAPSPAGRYREPSTLPDGRILVSWADGPVNDLAEQSITPPDFGVYIYDPVSQKNQLLYNDRQTWELNALPVAARKVPPVIGDIQHVADATMPVRVGSVNVTQTSLKETVNGAQFANVGLDVALKDAVGVRIIEGFSSEAAKGVTMFGLTMHEGAAVLGEAKVYADGSWLANIPPYLPVHLQPIDKFGLAIRSQGLWIQGMPGEDRRCVGCHESRTGQGVPAFGQNPTRAEQAQAENFMIPLADRVANGEYGWNTRVQPVLTAKCASCHNSTTNGNGPQTFYDMTRTDPVTGLATTYHIPRFDMSDTPVTVYYDRKVATYPASYVSIFFPAALEMGMQTTVIGTIPPTWGVPANARGSAMIAKVNLKAADGSVAYPGAMHPEDTGAANTLTDVERQMLVRVMDLGGQYYARQNTNFAAYVDPSSGLKY
jgi:Hydrazine synthase alpha subunit middle domain